MERYWQSVRSREEKAMSSDYDEYITRYCRKHGCTPAEAKQHALCREAEKYYSGKNKSAVIMRSEFMCRSES